MKQYVDRPSGELACLDAGHRAQACCSGESTITAEALMNNAGYVKTVVEMGWGGVKNGALLALAAKEFDAVFTVDKNLPYQQNVAHLPVAVIVLEAYSNELGALLPLVHNLDQALGSLQPRTFIRVGA
ncbi:MAG: hypothetical protein ABIO96_10880 [Nitrospiraceae bacterium]